MARGNASGNEETAEGGGRRVSTEDGENRSGEKAVEAMGEKAGKCKFTGTAVRGEGMKGREGKGG